MGGELILVMFSQLFDRVTGHLKDVRLWKFTLLAIVFSEICTATMSLLLNGMVRPDYLIVGFVVPLIVAPVVIIMRTNMEKVLLESEEKFRALFDYATDSILLLRLEENRGLIIADVNAATCLMHGYSKEELVGQPISMLYDPDMSEKELERTRRILEGESLTFEGRHFRKDGTVFPIEVSTCMFNIGKDKYVLGIDRDITKRKQAEQELKEHSHFLQSLINSIPNPIFFKDPEGVYQGCNKAFESFLGKCIDDIVGKSVYDLAPRELADEYHAMDEELLNNPGVQTYESSIIGALGQTNNVIFNKATFNRTDGSLGGLVGIITDITEQKLLEAQLRHSQKMEAIGTLTAGVSHEFNNIMTSIMGFGEFLQDCLVPASAERKYADMIVQSSERAKNLTNGMLAYSRKQVSIFEPVEINGVLGDIEAFLSNIVGENIVLNMVRLDEKLCVRADKSQLEQVILNLTTNAIDAMPDGGTLTIRIERKDPDKTIEGYQFTDGPEKHVLISVTDTGVGMDKDIKEKIFEPFYSTKDVGKGTGLSLSMVYGIIENHHGAINIISEPGEGTSFEIYLPEIPHALDPAEEGIEKIRATKGNETVLLAEDDEYVRSMVSMSLEKTGYIVLEASSGQEAVTVFRKNKDKIDLLLFDLAMPVKDGLIAYREIYKLNKHVKIAFLSGHSALDYRVKGIIDEGYAFVSKPVSQKNLLLTIRKVLDS